MSGLLGSIDKFDPELEDWAQYVERVGQFFEANGIVGEENAAKRRSTFLSVVGPSPYKLLSSILAPVKPSEKTFEELTEVLRNHYSPPPLEVMQRFRFNTRSRKPGESVATYVAELRRLAEYCNYGNTLEKMIRDRLVSGINDDNIQKKLLSEPALSYTRALEIARGAEVAEKNLREMRAPRRERETAGPQATGKQDPVYQITSGKQPRKQSFGYCYCCGAPGHKIAECKFKDKSCRLCGKKGHLARMCKSPRTPQPGTQRSQNQRHLRQIRQVEDDPGGDSEDSLEEVQAVNQSGGGKLPPLKVCLQVDECEIPMEIDTGASMSIMSEDTYRKIWPTRKLEVSNVKLQTYSKEPLPVVGAQNVQVYYEGQSASLPLIVVKGDGPTLLGRNWLGTIRIDWCKIHYTPSAGLQNLLEKYDTVFQDKLGSFKGRQAKIEVDPDPIPHFCKARTLPYSMRAKVEEEIDRLVSEGILEPVEYADWAAPVVAVLKSDRKSIRLCGDFRMTVNPVAKLHRHPIPRVEDLFATLQGGKKFTKLDLSQAYQQLPLHPDSRKYVVINTHKGLFRYTRLPYGISSAPGIFQKEMDNLLAGIPGVVVYLDDILVTGTTEKEHLRSLEEVLRRLDKSGLRARKSKCLFMAPSVSYLGHKIDAEGLHPLPDKLQAVKAAPTPRNVSELKSYLGLLTYYGKFLPNLSMRLQPLYQLLTKDCQWKWSKAQEKAFQESKDLLQSSQLLVHFNPQLPIILACDASAFGIGAVLAHLMPDGSEKPIGYASRTLNKAERNYSQLEKEGLSCVFGIKHFYSYLFGHPFELITDHKPLLGLWGEKKPTSPQASARIRRWALYLSLFEYTLKFQRTSAHSNADALSRLPLPVEPAIAKTPPELVLLAEHLDNSPVTAEQIRIGTRRDPVLSQVMQFLQQGWPSIQRDNPQLTPFFAKKDELSLYNGCILWGTRVVVPVPYHDAVLTELHDGHPGMARMKSLARMYVWWPGIASDIEKTVRQCTECQLHQSTPPVAPLQPWQWPTRPWARLHLDYAGPVKGRMYLIIVDAHSKWIEAVCTPSATSAAVIEELNVLFAQFGLPDTIVTDNGTCFVSAEFAVYLKKYGIKHITSAPYHPATNGMAERAVQIVKQGLRNYSR